MKSARADEVRLILPLLFRLATLISSEQLTDASVVEVFAGFDDVLRDRNAPNHGVTSWPARTLPVAVLSVALPQVWLNLR